MLQYVCPELEKQLEQGVYKKNTRHLPHLGDFPGGTRGKEPACQCRRRKGCGFDPWVRKIPWKRK